MIYKVDWISFSIPVEAVEDGNEKEAFYRAAASIVDLHEDLPTLMALDASWEPGNGRAPYRTRWQRELPGVTIYTHPALTHALVEVSGSGCDELAARGAMAGVLDAVQSRITRLDIACDILTEVRPLDFVDGRSTGRFKAQSHVLSESGETFYVGARSSARYARVYRYNPPHERSHFLRVEYVVKQQDAKNVVDAIQTEGLASVVASLGQTFGWQHPTWDVRDNPAEIAVYRPDRREGKTLFWLADTVGPCLARLHREGIIDIEQWVRENVIPHLNK